MTYLFDTSALLAHYREEPGWDQVEDLLKTEAVTVCVVSWLEFRIRLAEMTADQAEASEASAIYESLWSRMLPVDRLSVQAAWALRRAVRERIPLADCLIAGCAKRHNVTLVHRDVHLAAIPLNMLAAIQLPGLPPVGRGLVKEKGPVYRVRKRRQRA